MLTGSCVVQKHIPLLVGVTKNGQPQRIFDQQSMSDTYMPLKFCALCTEEIKYGGH